MRLSLPLTSVPDFAIFDTNVMLTIFVYLAIIYNNAQLYIIYICIIMYNYTLKQSDTVKYNQMLVTSQKCNRCAKSHIVTDSDSGEVICAACGLVISERMESGGPEHRNFLDNGPSNARTGDGTSLRRHDRGLSTIINPLNKDSTGKQLSSSMKSTINRLRIWDGRTQVHKSTEKNFRQAFNDLSRLQDKLGLSEAIIEKTAYIYRKAIEKNLVRGRSISALLAASLYAACRDAETTRTLIDVCEASNVKKKDLAKCYRVLVQELNLKMPVMNAEQCVSRIGNNLGVSEKTKRHAIKIIDEYRQSGDNAGKSPTGIAATSIYLANVKMNEKFTQKEVADAANVTEVTIRNRSNDIKKVLNFTSKQLLKQEENDKK